MTPLQVPKPSGVLTFYLAYLSFHVQRNSVIVARIAFAGKQNAVITQSNNKCKFILYPTGKNTMISQITHDL